MKGPFEPGQRLKIHWANDDSILICNVVPFNVESSDDLAVQWGNQQVHLWDGANGHMSYIFGLDDVTIEFVDEPQPLPAEET